MNEISSTKVAVEWICDLRLDSWPARYQQGDTCAVYAATALHELARFESIAHFLSDESLWAACQLNMRFGGLTLETVDNALGGTGQCGEHDFNTSVERSKPFRLSLYQHLQWYKARIVEIPVSISRIANALRRGNGVLLGLRLAESFYYPTAEGVIRTSPDDYVANKSHAVAIVGQVRIDGEDYFLVRNSWGPTWGDSGYGLITAGYVDKFGQAAAVVFSVDGKVR